MTIESKSKPDTGATGAPIPFVDLAAQQRRIGPSMEAAIRRVLDHGQYIMGPEVAALETELARFAGTRHCVTCASGTDALLLPLLAWGVGPGDAVFTTTFSFIATAEVIALFGATPVFADIDPVTFNLDAADLERRVRAVEAEGRLRPRAVIPVDLFGLPADYEAIGRVAKAHHLLVLEDAAQGFGGACGGRRACAFGDAGATSFFPAKPLGCYGDGGAVFTDDDGFDSLLRSLRVHGQGASKYENVRIGLNGRLDTLQAAILLEKMKVFPAELEARERVAQSYTKRLSAAGASARTPVVPPGFRSAWAQYTLRVKGRDAVQAALKRAGIPTMIYYPIPLHLQKAFAGAGGRPGDLPAAEAAAAEVLSLPMHPYLDEATIERVGAAVAAAAGGPR